MNLNECKNEIYSLISEYWGGATVIWGSQRLVTTPKPPLVVLQVIGTIKRPTFPIKTTDNDGEIVTTYQNNFMLQIDLYTESGNLNYPDSPENTAMSDLQNFCCYMDSQKAIDWCYKNDIQFYNDIGVTDLTDIINDTQYRYRAMCQYNVSFTQNSKGYANISPTNGKWQQTKSGGGTQELANQETGYFTKVNIEQNNS
jgi:hypothetical protein